jgi:Txe/YoeB family toxin of Txe-Axe toxin-antitoxin module
MAFMMVGTFEDYRTWGDFHMETPDALIKRFLRLIGTYKTDPWTKNVFYDVSIPVKTPNPKAGGK